MATEIITAGADHRLAGQVLAVVTHLDMDPDTGAQSGSASVDFHDELTSGEKTTLRNANPRMKNYPEA